MKPSEATVDYQPERARPSHHLLNVDLIRVALYQAVTAGLSVGALVGTTGYQDAPTMGKQWLAIFCASMLVKMSHASALNGGVTVGKVA